jgi:1-hydroxycarotenoid 3,4-desaturase
MAQRGAIVIGAGIGGLVAALDLACAGYAVTVLERADAPGGKMRQVLVDGAGIDAGPTVFTMRWVFEEIFADAGASLADHVALRPARVLARHAWGADQRLDLSADIGESAAAIGDFAGPAEARGFLEFSARARRIYETLEKPFLRGPLPTPVSLMRSAGLADMLAISPFDTLMRALSAHFRDPRLRQLFGRYATYCGSSPYLAPATLMLVAHVERDGVWLVEGGMHGLARALAALAAAKGAYVRYGAHVAKIEVSAGRACGVVLADGERLAADAVVLNADSAALAAGCFGAGVAGASPAVRPAERSLSAVTWALHARTSGFPLSRHNVFFSADYKAEFVDIFSAARLPRAPTVYLCAQDRDDDAPAPDGPERLLCLVNAPASGDRRQFSTMEIEQCAQRSFAFLAQCGLQVERSPAASVVTAPHQFEALFPATGGALYGQAVHGSMATFRRPGSRTKLPGLYLAGGSTHPGAGVPMAALSGRLAAASLRADGGSTSR